MPLEPTDPRRIEDRRRLLRNLGPAARRLAALALGLGCASSALAQGAPLIDPLSDDPALVPELDWQPCGDRENVDCATARVPLDYDDPYGATIGIALARHRATDPARRIGSLFANPGGPGDPGKPLALRADEVFEPELVARFDVVGFDPRFTGDSETVGCISSEEEDALFADVVHAPRTDEQRAAADRAYAQYAALCAQRAPQLQYAGTGNVARDLDLLRRAVGDERLTFVGISYGTVIGQTYAAMYPERVRALVLDAVVDGELLAGVGSTLPMRARTHAALGSSDTFREFLRLCAEAGPQSCPFAQDGDPSEKFAQLMDHLSQQPPRPDEGDVYSELAHMVAGNLYFAATWLQVAYQLQLQWETAFSPAPPDELTEEDELPVDPFDSFPLASAYAKHTSLALSLAASDESQAVARAITCADSTNPRDFASWVAAAEDEEAAAPYFGRLWIYKDLACAHWSLPARGAYFGPYDRMTSAPVLVMSTRYDPSTRYEGAVSVAARFPNARLLTLEGWGHGAHNQENRCMKEAAARYLVDLTWPETTTCQPDFVPFQ